MTITKFQENLKRNLNKSFIQLLKDNNHQGNICCEGCFRLGKEEARKETIKLIDDMIIIEENFDTNEDYTLYCKKLCELSNKLNEKTEEKE